MKPYVHLRISCGSSLREVGVVFEEALPQIINWLPIRRDEEEAFYVYGAICDQIQAYVLCICAIRMFHC